MRRSFLTFAAATAVLAFTPQSQAAPIAPDGLRAALDNTAITENAQFVWQGGSYCWYDGGWHGPGWYQCGFQFRRGLGWGGGVGWNNWERGRRFGGERFEHRGGRGDRGDRVGRGTLGGNRATTGAGGNLSGGRAGGPGGGGGDSGAARGGSVGGH
jgi:hypothetical protein